MNNVFLIGRLTRDPELRFTTNENNTAVARFTLAVDRQLSKDKKAELERNNQPTADFISIVVWGKQAENCNEYLVKGRLVAISGRIQTGSYEAQDGSKRYTTEVVAEKVQFLQFGDINKMMESKPAAQATQQDMTDIEGFYQVDNEDIPF